MTTRRRSAVLMRVSSYASSPMTCRVSPLHIIWDCGDSTLRVLIPGSMQCSSSVYASPYTVRDNIFFKSFCLNSLPSVCCRLVRPSHTAALPASKLVLGFWVDSASGLLRVNALHMSDPRRRAVPKSCPYPLPLLLSCCLTLTFCGS